MISNGSRSFKLDFHFEQQESSKIPTVVSSLCEDLFPFYCGRSLTTVFIICEMLAYFLVPIEDELIKTLQWKWSQFIVSFILAPFSTHSVLSLLIHAIFMANIGAEIEYKLHRMQADRSLAAIENRSSINSDNKAYFCWKNYFQIGLLGGWQKYVGVMWLSTAAANLLAVLFSSNLVMVASNMGSYSLYLYLQLLNYRKWQVEAQQANYQSQIMGNEQEREEASNQDSMVIIYKCILVSYGVYVGVNGEPYGSFNCYLWALGIIFGCFWAKIL